MDLTDTAAQAKANIPHICWALHPDGKRACIKDAGHEDHHGWEAPPERVNQES